MVDTRDECSAILTDSITNYEAVKYFCAEESEARRYKEARECYISATNQVALLRHASNFLEQLFNIMIRAGCGYLIASLIEGGESSLTPGDFMLFSTYVTQLDAPSKLFRHTFRIVGEGIVDVEKMVGLMNEKSEIDDSKAAIELESVGNGIEFRNVSFNYSEGIPVLRDVSFSVRAGETVALVGESGSGKSTIIKLLFRLYDVTDGEICVNDRDIRTVSLGSLRRMMAVVPQDTTLFNDTIRFNIAFGRPNASDEDIKKAARTAAIHEFIESQPQGYDTVVGERGLRLSGGQKQRIAIARLVLKDADVVLLDEATSALDSATERSVQTSLASVCRAKTSVVVAHRLSTVVHADKIVVLYGGRIVESGRHEQLLRMGGAYAKMWRLQVGFGQDVDATDLIVN
ncbi:hypothetical protein AAVH_23404 [Aphelenchoides avenae]|nr:hypothetical protein AAVH_23404 [Aphelenchus avenae]